MTPPRAATRRDPLAVLGVLALSTGVAVLALATARGVVPLGGVSYETEFVSDWWWLAFLLAPLPGLAARRRPGTGPAVGAALVVPHVVAATVCVRRYATSGWGDGLEVFAYLHPLLLAGAAAALVAALRRRG